MLRAEFFKEDQLVTDIVLSDYRTADVFRRYGIDYCCGGKLPLSKACELKHVDIDQLCSELLMASHTITISNTLSFEEWDMDFLVDYIINVHHAYLRKNIPTLQQDLDRFIAGHRKKFPFLDEVQKIFNQLSHDILPHLRQEEEIIFPYIKQIAHAYHGKETYARLLVRTLRKPVEDVMHHEHQTLLRLLNRLRTLTNEYHLPTNACAANQVSFLKLKELDDDLSQHIYLENEVLFPRAIAMEKELLHKND